MLPSEHTESLKAAVTNLSALLLLILLFGRRLQINNNVRTSALILDIVVSLSQIFFNFFTQDSIFLA